MACINIKHPSFIQLMEETNLPSIVLEFKVNKWQSDNNTGKFPTVNEISKKTNINYQKNQNVSNEGIIASEKTIRDLSAKIADRIGMKVAFESDRSKDYKGKIENNVAYVNLAYATLDTPIHEILGHPIIRAIKDRSKNQEDSSFNKLYENLLEELSTTQRGKEVLDRIKRDYTNKTPSFNYSITNEDYTKESIEEINNIRKEKGLPPLKLDYLYKIFSSEKEAKDYVRNNKPDDQYNITVVKNEINTGEYSLEEQQEEAIVELLGLMTAEKLDNVKDGKLISLLKRLLKEMKQFVRSLINQKEVEIDKLPDNMTINDLSDLLAYSNSKLILPGYEVEYTTPDNEKFKTYQEASNHISELAKNVEDVNLDSVEVKTSKKIKSATEIKVNSFKAEGDVYVKYKDQWYTEYDSDHRSPLKENIVVNLWNLQFNKITYTQSDEDGEYYIDTIESMGIDDFIEKNKEYEQSKEIIEEWKKVNNIQYNPEEIYSRGQEFSSVVGAYSEFDVNLMMQNLLSHIEDNEKAGGKFAISAYTKPIDKQIGHLEGGGGKIKFKLYPQSNDILWAANTDVYSGSVWDASEKVNKDKKSELLGVSYTKYPNLSNANAVQPNLASIIDDLSHHHNELGISLTGSNFRLEYDEDIPYQTKKIIDSINSILDQKYGKLVKPDIKEPKEKRRKTYSVYYKGNNNEQFRANSEREANEFIQKHSKNWKRDISEYYLKDSFVVEGYEGIQPTQTNETLKESIESIKKEYLNLSYNDYYIHEDGSIYESEPDDLVDYEEDIYEEVFDENGEYLGVIEKSFKSNKKEIRKFREGYEKKQALINTKIAVLKEIAKKQPRSLIRSEVVLTNKIAQTNRELGFEGDELPFQKVPNVNFEELIDPNKTEETVEDNSKSPSEILFNNQQGKIEVNSVLQNIVDNFSDLSEEALELINKSIRLQSKSGAKIKFVDESIFDEGVVMDWDSNTNTIRISRSRINKFSAETVVAAFIHEVVHSTTGNAYLNPQTQEDRDFKKLIDDYFNKYESLSSSYGFKNQMEFIAELYSNSDFASEVKRLSQENKDKFWNKLINAIRRLFGIKLTNEYNNLIENVIREAERDQSGFKGLQGRGQIYNARVEEKSKYATLEDKLTETIKQAQDRIEAVYKRTLASTNSKSDTEKQKHLDNIKSLVEELELHSESQKWKAILAYTKSFNQTVNTVTNLVDKLLKENDPKDDNIMESVSRYEDYLAAYDLLKEINGLISSSKMEMLNLTKEELEEIKELESVLINIENKHPKLKNNFLAIKRLQALKIFSDPKYNTEVETKWKRLLTVEYNGLADKQGLTVNQYISKMLSGRDAQDYKEDLELSAQKLINDPSMDISTFVKGISDPLNTNSRIIQVITNIIGETIDSIKNQFRNLDLDLSKKFDKFIKDKGNLKPSELYKGMYEQDSEGNYYLKTKYSVKFKELYESELRPLMVEKNKLISDNKENGISEEETKLTSEYSAISAKMKIWFKTNTVKSKGKTIPNPKFLNVLPTGTNLEMLKEFVTIDLNNIKKFGKKGSLVTEIFNANFHKLPSITKSDLERRIELDTKGLIKDKIGDLSKVKADDIGVQSQEEAINAKGEVIRDVKIHFRGNIENNQQSLDLMTMYRKEMFNGINYEAKSKIRPTMHIIADISAGKGYFKESKKFGGKIQNLFNKRSPNQLIEGEFSNEYQRILGLLERNVYDTLSHYGGKTFFGADINKVTSGINGYAAGVAMAFNIGSGAANIANGFTSLFIEAVGGDKFKRSSLRKAEARYAKDLPNIFADLTNPVKKSFTNQLIEMFDAFGGLDPVEQDSIRNNFARKFASTKMMNFINDSGEHAMHGVITMAMLDDIKVMNANQEYIDKNGNVVEESKAASMLDMLQMKDGVLSMSDKVIYSKRNLTTPYHEGGKTHINMLVKKKVFDLFGVYDNNFKNEFSKAWYGKSVMMFKNFFVSGMQYRYAGISSSLKEQSNLTDDELFYSSAEKEYIEGTYTTLIRFFKNGVIPNLKSLELMYMNYNNLSEYEKSNLRKATLEIVMTSVILPAIGLLLAGADPDSDDEELWFAIYVTRRLESELSQFRNPIEASKILQNPVAGIRIVQNALNFTYDVVTPFNFVPNEDKNQNFFSYMDEDSEGKNKLGKRAKKLVPIWSQLEKDYRNMYNLQFNK